jgi:hypothetical protein
LRVTWIDRKVSGDGVNKKQIQNQPNPKELYIKYAEQHPGIIDIDTPAVKNDIQLTALDLYGRGMNVFPIKPQDKHPYLTKRAGLFYNRLHHCTAACTHGGRREDITELFNRRDNLAVMTGRSSGNLIALDCDSHTSFELIGKELTARALPFWAVIGRRGGAYLLRVIEGEAANMPAGKARVDNVEIWGNRRLIVLPPSIHPDTGKPYQWGTPEPRYHLQAGEGIPAVSIAALDWLGVTLAKSAKRWEEPELHGLGDWAAMLSYENRQTLAGVGVSEGNRNSKLFSALCDLKANGRSYHEAEQMTREYCQRTGLDIIGAMSTLKSAYRQERTTPKNRGGERVREWQRASILAESFDWRGTFGRKARTLKACYMACIERAKLDGRLHWRATWREVGEIMQADYRNAGRYINSLVEAGLIKRTDYKDAGIYRFLRLSEFTPLETTGSYSGVNWELPKTRGEKDAFTYLGLTAWYVWKYLLTHDAKNGAAIIKALGLPSSSVYAALKALQHDNVRLVSSAEGMLYGEPKTEASLQAFAFAQFDGSSPSQARRERNQLDRERNANRAIRNARDWHARKGKE